MCLEVWMWMYQEYGMSWIVRVLFILKSNDFPYLTVIGDSGMNVQKDETYDLQCINGKTTMTIKRITEHMSIHCSIFNIRQ